MNPWLHKSYARDFKKYLKRRYQNCPHPADKNVTLEQLCKRFRLKQAEALEVIDSCDYLFLSEFAYKPSSSDRYEDRLWAAWSPQLWKNAPTGKKIVVNIDA